MPPIIAQASDGEAAGKLVLVSLAHAAAMAGIDAPTVERDRPLRR